MSEANNREQVLLKTSMFGFEKKQVLEYIDSIWNTSRSEQQELEAKLKEVGQARNELERQVSEFEAKMSQLERHLEDEKGRIRELTGQISSLNQELAGQKELAAKQARELSIQQERNRQLQFRSESSEYKAQKYDEAANKLGEILIDARRSADAMLRAAGKEAQGIKRDAVEAADRITGEVRSFRGDLDRVRETMEELMRSLGDRLDGIDAVISKMEQRAADVRETARREAAPDQDGRAEGEEGDGITAKLGAAVQSQSGEPQARAAETSFFRDAAEA